MRAFRTAARKAGADQRPRARLLWLALVGAIAALALTSAAAQAEGVHERPNGSLEATCTSATFHFRGFPNAPGNTVNERLAYKSEGTETVLFEGTFTFDGPEGSNTITFGHLSALGGVDGLVSWNTNGFKGAFDILFGVNCAVPGYTIEKLQKISGSGGPFTKEPLLGELDNLIEYEILIKDTGNTKLKLENFEDKRCTEISGPSEISPGETAVFTCHHTVVPADLAANYANQATVTGKPPGKQGSPKTKKSNIVVVKFPVEHTRENGTVKASCNQITFQFFGFPNAPNNKVTETITVSNTKGYKKVYTVIFTFNGPTGENTVKIVHPPGYAIVDGLAKWNTNGFKGSFDAAAEVYCEANPAFSAEKLQKIEGGPEGFTTAPISGAKEGQTIDYEIVAHNEGNTPLAFGTLLDANCEEIAGGPTGVVEAGESTTWTCKHLITEENVLGGFYANTAEVTGSFETKSTTKATNTVEAGLEP